MGNPARLLRHETCRNRICRHFNEQWACRLASADPLAADSRDAMR